VGREALQQGLYRQGSWAVTNYMKYNKCWILHLGWDNPGYTHKVGDERLESSPR